MTLFERPSIAYFSILTLGIWNTCIGFILWLWGLSAAPDIGRANYLFFLKPVIAALLAAPGALLFLGGIAGRTVRRALDLAPDHPVKDPRLPEALAEGGHA